MLLSCGDALVDFLPVKSADGRDAAVPVAGGSCLNIAVGMARLGAPAGFVGGISTDLFGRIIDDQGAAQALAMLKDARGSVTISFDPNCRPKLVKHKTHYVERMNAFAAIADIVRMSDVDFEFLYGGGDHAGRAKSFIEAGASLVVVTRGIKGAQAWHKQAGGVEVGAPTVDVVDTIGAGDSFQAALLFALRAIGRIKSESLAQTNADELRRALSFASGCAALTCGRAGADPPRQADVGAELSRLLPA